MTGRYFFIGMLISGFITICAIQIVPQPNTHNTYMESHYVGNVYSPCCLDIAFELKGDNHINYINRGIELNLKPIELYKILQAEKVDFTFIKHRSLFGPKHRTIAKIQLGDKIIYNAFT